MSEPSMAEIWDSINEVLDLQCGKFNVKLLSSRRWYLQSLSILFPFLSDQWSRIASQVQSEEASIDRILLVLTQEGLIPEDYLAEVKGRNVVNGDQQSIMILIQLINELVEQALEQGEEGEEGNYSQNQHENEEEQYQGQDFNKQKQLEQPLVKSKSPITAKANSQPDKQRDAHSVLGIGHQFDDQEPSEHSEDHPNFQQQPQGFNNQFATSIGDNRKTLKMTHQEEEDEQDNYLNQKLNKCKSQEQLKNIPKKKAKVKKQKKVRGLVAHPPLPKHYPKATTPAQKKLTQDVKSGIAGSRKVFDKQNYGFGSPTAKDQLNTKKREMNYFTSKHFSNQRKQSQQPNGHNVTKLKKLLKWKQSNLKKRQKEIQQDLEMKVQLKKQNYVKTINKLIINLEKQKMLDRKREEKERQNKQKELAEKRLLAIEQQYKDQMSFLQSRSSGTRKKLAHTDHRSIIQGLQRELKRQNQKQINDLKTRLRREQAQLDDDLQVLQKQIIRAYKHN